jgi:outer membrane protein assembly factor BamB
MMSRRMIVRCALIVALAMAAEGCGQKNFLPNPFKSKTTKGYQGKGKRIPVLDQSRSLEPSAALKGIDFALPPAQPIAAWPTPAGPGGEVDHVQAADAFEVAWRKKVGAGASRQTHILAPPVIADGLIFTLDGEATVSARSVSSGDEVWKENLRPRNRRDREAYGGGVAYAGGTVYVASGFRFVAALDAKTGKEKWRTQTQSPLHTAPNVADGRVFVTDVEDQLFAFDAATGTVNWNYQALEEPARIRAASSPTVSGEVVVAPFASGEVVAMRTTNGSVLWMDTLSFTNRNNALSEIRDIAGRPVVYRGDVFAGSHSGVFGAITLRDGQRRWDLPITSITTPWAAGDVVYVVDQSGQVLAIARDSGQIYWSVKLNADVQKGKKVKKIKNPPVWSGVILASNRLVLVNSSGLAVTLNPKTGAKLGELKLGGPAYMTPVAAGGRLYVLTDKADLVAIR